MNSRIQERGNCQVCGADQAVRNGLISKHKDKRHSIILRGSDDCPGNAYAPLQMDRSVADGIVKGLREKNDDRKQRFSCMKDGTYCPEYIVKHVGPTFETVTIPFAEGTPEDQYDQVLSDIRWQEDLIRAEERLCEDMIRFIHLYSKTALREVVLNFSTDVTVGQVRLLNGFLKVTVTAIKGDRVEWKTSGGKDGWTSLESFRKFQVV